MTGRRGGAAVDEDTGEVRRYLSQHSALMEDILFLVHLTSGMPGRATELATYTIANGASAGRAVIKSGKRICLSAQYSKTGNLGRSTEPVARYLDEDFWFKSCLS